MMIGPERGGKKAKAGKSGKKKAKAAAKAANEAAVPATSVDTSAALPFAPEGMPELGPSLIAWIDRLQEHVDHLLTLVDLPEEEEEPGDDAASGGPESGLASAEPTQSTEPVDSMVEGAGPGEPTAPQETISLAEMWRRRHAADGQGPDAPGLTDPAATPGVTEPVAAVDGREADTADTPEVEADLSEDWSGLPEAGVAGEADRPAAWAGEPDVPEDGVHYDYEPEPEPAAPLPEAPATPSAVLVARELLGRGATHDDVFRRLQDGYGVADPQAVLAATRA